MKPTLIVYATRAGHPEWVAEHISESLLRHGVFVELGDAAQLTDFDLGGCYGSVIVVASVHRGQHEPDMLRFVKHHRRVLERLPTAFLSVSLALAAAEMAATSPETRRRAAAQLRAAISKLCEDTGWTPSWTLAVAGALPYRRFKRPLQWVMRTLARAHELPDNATSRDDGGTDWTGIENFARAFVDEHRHSSLEPLPLAAHG